MTGDFPDRDEWTDRPDSPEAIAAEQAAIARDMETMPARVKAVLQKRKDAITNQLAREAEEAMEAADDIGECDCCSKPGKLSRCIAYGIETSACEKCRGISDEDAEWDALGATDLIEPEELAKKTDLSDNAFSDV